MGKPVVLVVMDGIGWTEKDKGNAVMHAYKPQLDELMTKWPHTTIRAHGVAVGLPSDDDMGNSEVGHLNLGAGRIVYQELTRITKSIEDGDFFSNQELIAAIDNCKKNNSKLHILGLVSDGGVHSHDRHLYGF